jgi:CRP-like cAMP-binding protein
VEQRTYPGAKDGVVLMTRYITAELRQLPVFAALSKRALLIADSLLTPVTFDDGDVICQEDHLGRQAFIIVSGSAVVSRGDEAIATVGPGDVVGEIALLGDGRRTASVTAIEPVRAFVMSAQEFNSVLALPGVNDEIRRIADQRRPVTRQPVAAA